MLSATVKVIKRTDYSKKLNEINRKFLPLAGKVVESYAKRLTPVDSGRLRSSIGTQVGREEVSIGTNVNYAPHVEYGTKRMKAQPYMRPAVDKNRKSIIKLYRDIFRSVFSGS